VLLPSRGARRHCVGSSLSDFTLHRLSQELLDEKWPFPLLLWHLNWKKCKIFVCTYFQELGLYVHGQGNLMHGKGSTCVKNWTNWFGEQSKEKWVTWILFCNLVHREHLNLLTCFTLIFKLSHVFPLTRFPWHKAKYDCHLSCGLGKNMTVC
jgi:hypothetical protein